MGNRIDEGIDQGDTLLGGRLVTAGTNAVGVFEKIFEGNPLELSKKVEYDESLCSLKLHIDCVVTDNLRSGIWDAAARITWAGGRGQGASEAIVDLGPRGTVFSLGSTEYLKVEIATFRTDVVDVNTRWRYELGLVRHMGGIVLPAYRTIHVGDVAAGATSALFATPAFSAEASIQGQVTPVAVARDALRFFYDAVPNLESALLLRHGVEWPGIPNGAQFFAITNNAAVLDTYKALFKLRLT